MSYAIHYAPAPQEQKKNHKNRAGLIGAVLILAVCLLAFGWSLPRQARQLREILLPWTRESVQTAFSEFCADLRRGDMFYDAAMAFCREIMNETNVLQ